MILIREDGTRVYLADSELELEIANERRQEMKQLEHDVAAVSEINNVLSKVITEQGGEIDYLDYLIDESKTNVIDGTQNLQEAEMHNNSYRRKMWAMIATVGTVVVGTIGFGFLSRSKSNDPK